MSRLICCNLFLFQIATTLLQKAFQQIKVLFDKFFSSTLWVGKKLLSTWLGGTKSFRPWCQDKYPFQLHALNAQKPKLYIYPSHGAAFFMTKACCPPRIDCTPCDGRITWKFLDQQTWKSTFFQLLLLLSSVGREILASDQSETVEM